MPDLKDVSQVLPIENLPGHLAFGQASGITQGPTSPHLNAGTAAILR